MGTLSIFLKFAAFLTLAILLLLSVVGRKNIETHYSVIEFLPGQVYPGCVGRCDNVQRTVPDQKADMSSLVKQNQDVPHTVSDQEADTSSLVNQNQDVPQTVSDQEADSTSLVKQNQDVPQTVLDKEADMSSLVKQNLNVPQTISDQEADMSSLVNQNQDDLQTISDQEADTASKVNQNQNQDDLQTVSDQEADTSSLVRQNQNVPQTISIQEADVTSTDMKLEESRRAWEKENRASLEYGVDIAARLKLSVDGDIHHPLQNFRNRCWRERLTGPEPNVAFWEYCHFPPASPRCQTLNDFYRRQWTAGGRSRLRCFPSFFFVGVTKSGTTDLKYQLYKHPQIVRPLLSEINWWNRRRQGDGKRAYGSFGKNVTFDEYLGAFDLAAVEIDKITQVKNNRTWHPALTFDGSSQMFWEHDGWESLPANRDTDEPRVTYIDSIRALNPDAKIIIMFRDPVERLFSHYCMLMGEAADPDHFHEQSVHAVERMERCLDRASLRKCVFDTELYADIYKKGMITLRTSMYAAFYLEWLTVFGKDRILVVRSEDYYSDRLRTLNSIAAFLGLDPFPPEHQSVNEDKPKFQRHNKPRMLPDTRAVLRRFFSPHNTELSRLLGDSRYLWVN